MKAKEVTSEVQVATAIERYGKPVIATLVIVAVLVGGVFAFDAWTRYQEKVVQEKLFAVQKKVDKITEDLNKKNEEANKSADDKKKTAPVKKVEMVKTPETLKQNYDTALADLEKFAEENKKYAAGAMAAVQAAGLAVDYKDLDRAKKTLEQVVSQPNKGSLFFGLLHTQLGSVLMDLKQYNEAITQFQNVVDDKSQTYFHAHALVRMGACYMATGQWDKAEGALNQVEADFANTQAAQDAKNLKRLVSLKKGA